MAHADWPSSSSSTRGLRPHHLSDPAGASTSFPVDVLEFASPSPLDDSWAPSNSSGSPRRLRQPSLKASLSNTRMSSKTSRTSPAPTRDASDSSLSSSSSSASTSTPIVPSTSATGRKVAANLQLFKETAPEVTGPRRSLSRQSPVQRVASGHGTDAATPSFQPLMPTEEEEEEELVRETKFVKRTAWPEREAAANRRGKSTTAVRRATLVSQSPNREQRDDKSSRSRDSVTSKDPFKELMEWRQDTLDRGRSRLRPDGTSGSGNGIGSDINKDNVWPPEPSPISIPTSPHRRSLPHKESTQSIRTFHSSQSLPQPTSPGHERKRVVSFSITPELPRSKEERQESRIRTSPSIPSPNPESPWTSDSESAWDTTSIASSLATTTSPSGESRHPHRHHTLRDRSSPKKQPPPQLTVNGDAEGEQDGEDDEAAYGTLDELEPSETPLPNVPLRPFRNQVGGHSAIYKFTKRAVCKVSTPLPFFFGSSMSYISYSRLASLASRVQREPLLRGSRKCRPSTIRLHPSVSRRHVGQLP
jgi:inositol-hexakisphosphate kinase